MPTASEMENDRAEYARAFADDVAAPAPGLAPYGILHSGEGAKGKGYFGALPTPGGDVSTEISADDPEIGEYPLLVPTLSRGEIDHLLKEQRPTPRIDDKARAYALKRKAQGLSPFAQPNELHYPLPQ